MANVLIVAYLLIVLALIAVILLQRSEGGALGIGGGTGGGLVSVRGSANLLTRTTAILAALFFATAIGLTILSEIDRRSRGILEQAADSVGTETNSSTNILDSLNLNPSQLDNSPAPDAATTPSSDPALALPSTPEAATTPTTAAPAADAAATPTIAAPAAMTPAPATTPAQPMSAPATPAAPAQ
jgi:preprotein translocase subunit SecG